MILPARATGQAPHILLSAFACLPDRGSEPGVAWNWIVTLARRGCQLTVVTQERHRAAIEGWRARDSGRSLAGVEFRYVGLLGTGPIPFGTIGHYLYYYVWQAAAVLHLLRTGAWRQAALIHHLTYGGINTGSLLFLLPRPFMFGPVGGGETAPLRLARRFGPKPVALELARLAITIAARVNPILLMMQLRAVRILAKTPATARCLPTGGRKVKVAVEIGAPAAASSPQPVHNAETGTCRILYAGRLLYWKGAEILADALVRLDRPGSNLEVIVIGTGKRAPVVARAFSRLVHIKVVMPGSVPQHELFAVYAAADMFVFPSLHDSSGNVVLEALAFGLPVICLDLGGPPLLVGEAGIVVTASGAYDEVVDRLAAAIRELADDPAKRALLSARALTRAKLFSWDEAVRDGYGPLLDAVMTVDA